MRAGAKTVPQTLTTEAASVLKHSLSLGRRRGHAQVTPLHVAATLLSSRTSLLRRACLKSQSPPQAPTHHHPIHSRALELCFNVALNRLPTTPGPLLHGQPSLSNALIAALKRAQAHQRRGCIEQQQQQQQQPLLTIKVELEQLIISILDDPSVSRVMREAGFSSTLVKNNLEDSASVSPVFQYCCNGGGGGGVYSSPCSPNSAADVVNTNVNFWQTHLLSYASEQNPLFFSPFKKVTTDNNMETASFVVTKQEDVKLVFEVLMRKKRRNTMIVGNSVGLNEALVADIMGKFERNDVPEELKSVHFIRFQFSSVPLRLMRREEVEMNLSDLKRKVDSFCCGGRGVVIFTGDLKWTFDDQVNYGDHHDRNYSAVDHLVAEIGRLLCEYSNSNMKVWLVGTANYQTYMKCQMKQPSLEIQWSLQAVSVPSGGLGLALNAPSVHESRMALSQIPSQVLDRKTLTSKEEQGMFTCTECTANYEKEAASLKSGQNHKPFWLQTQGPESLEREALPNLRRKWSRLCHCLHQGRLQNQIDSSALLRNQRLNEKNYFYTSTTPWWPNQNSASPPETRSISFADTTLKHNRVTASSIPRFRRQQSCRIEFNYSERNHKHQVEEPNLNSLKSGEGKEVKITFALGNSLSSSDSGTGEKRTREKNICKLLQENVPWQSERIPSIVQVLIDNFNSIKKESSWFLIHGNDSIGKRRLALAIAESVLGSAEFFLCMNMGNKEHKVSSNSEILERALRKQEKLVVLVEDVDLADAQFIEFLSDGLKTKKFGDSSALETIFILTKGDNPTKYLNDGKKITTPVIQMKLQVNETRQRFDQKRKAECDFLSKSKSARINEKEIKYLIISENAKSISRQLGSNTLDLNIVANDDIEDDKLKEDYYSPISSDVTLETANELQNPLGFLESIKNQYVFEKKDPKIKYKFLSKIKSSFEELFEGENDVIYVDEVVLEELLHGCGLFLEKLFDKWLKDIFQTRLHRVRTGGKETVSIRLCLDTGKGDGGIEENGYTGSKNGYMGSNLPKEIL